MTDTQVAPRRLPFEIGTKTVFVQAAPPPGWVQEVVNDKFLRVVSAGGGVTGGPLSRVTDTVDLAHSHSIGSHSHPMGSHTHDATHYHTLPDCTYGLVDFTMASIEGGAASYEVLDNGLGWSTAAHIRVDGGSNNEGQHDHEIAGTRNGSDTGTSTGDTVASTDSTGSTSSTTNSTNAVNTPWGALTMVHAHTVASDFRPRYKDAIIARLVG